MHFSRYCRRWTLTIAVNAKNTKGTGSNYVYAHAHAHAHAEFS